MNVLYTEEQLRAASMALAPAIVKDLGQHFTMIPILNGGFIFAADLARSLYRAGADPEVDFLQLSSYGDAQVSSGNVRIVKDLNASVEGKNVLLVDDVLDSGRSAHFAVAMMRERGAAKVSLCVAVDKVQDRANKIEADHALFSTGADAFLVGYGMDDAGFKRAMPDIGVLN